MTEKQYYEILLKSDQFVSGLERIERKMDGFESKLKGIGTSMTSVFGGNVLAQAFDRGVGMLTGAITKTVTLGAEMEQTRISFETMLGSGKKATELLKDLTAFAEKTPFNQQDVISGAKSLLAYGFEAEKLTANMTTLGDVSAGLSIPIGDLIYLYGTLKTQGKAMTKDLMQFAGRGIPIYKELSKVLGVSIKEVGEMTTAGKVSFETVEAAFKNMTKEGSMFGGLMEKQSASLSGRWATFNDKVDNLYRTIGESLNPVLGKALDYVSRFIPKVDSLKEQFSKQKKETEYLSYNLTSLLNRYDELQTKTLKTTEEQTELRDIIQEIARVAPSAATGFDAYGNAVDISREKVEKFNTANADALRFLNKDAIKEQENSLKEYATKAMRLTNSLNAYAKSKNPNQFMGSGGAGSFGGVSLNAGKTEEEINEMRSQLRALTGKGGLIESTKESIASLSGKRTESEKLKDLLEGIATRDKLYKTGTATTTTTGKEKSKSGAGLEKITSGTKNITLNIAKIQVAENMHSNKMNMSDVAVTDIIKRALLTAVNDVNIAVA